MYKQIPATRLSHSTKEVLELVREEKDPIMITNHKKPIAMIVNYTQWQETGIGRNPNLELLRKYMIKLGSGKKVDTAALIRKSRDED